MSPLEYHLTIVNMVLQAISISTNLLTLKFIKDTFDITQGLYLILSIDSVTISVSVFSGFLIYASLLVPSMHYGNIGCFFLAYFSHLAFYTTPFLTFLISFIR